MRSDSKIYVAGHRGLVGSALLRCLHQRGFYNVVTRTHTQLDLADPRKTLAFFEKEKPEYVFMAAAKIGGIQTNVTRPAELLYNNISIQSSVIRAAAIMGVERLIFFGSSCVYPSNCQQPMSENDIFSGRLEESVEPSAISKISGISLCQAYNNQYGTNFLTVVPPTLYGPNDNFDLNDSHVVAALLRKFHEAQQNDSPSVKIWGTGLPRREFLFVDDLATASLFLMELDSSVLEPCVRDTRWVLNAGVGQDMTISELAMSIKNVVGYVGSIENDKTYPDGARRKLLNSFKITQLGWAPRVTFSEGIDRTYEWYKNHY